MSTETLFSTEYTNSKSINSLSTQFNEPDWLLQRRQQALLDYEDLLLDKDTLFYKYTNFKNFDPKSLTPNWKVAEGDFNVQTPILQEEPDLIETEFGTKSLIDPKLREQGVILDSLENIINDNLDLAKTIIESADNLSDRFDKLGSLAKAFARNIIILYVPKDMVIAKPLLKVVSNSSNQLACYSEFISIFDENSQATLIELFTSSSNDKTASQLYCSQHTVILKENARVSSLQIQDWDQNTLHVVSKVVSLNRYSIYRSLSHLQGGLMTRHNSNVILNGQGAEGYDLFVQFGNNKQRFDVKSELRHAAPDTIGQTHARTVMTQRSESILRGLIVIDKVGVNADSWLTSKGMTIGRGKISAVPSLEILQNEVKAAHAASVEPLNEDILFYLESRGIARDSAREMLVKGYFEYVLKLLEDENIVGISREYLINKWESSQVMLN